MKCSNAFSIDKENLEKKAGAPFDGSPAKSEEDHADYLQGRYMDVNHTSSLHQTSVRHT